MATRSLSPQRSLGAFVDRQRNLLLRLGIVGAVLGAAALLGLLMSNPRFEPLMLAVVPLAVVGAIVVVRYGRFEYGLMLIPLSAGLLNFVAISTGTQSRIVISLALSLGLFGLWLFRMLYEQRRLTVKPSPINWPVVVFVLVNILSYFWSVVFRDSILVVWGSFSTVQIAALVVNCMLPLLTILLLNKINDVRWLRALAWIMVGLGVVWVSGVALNLPLDPLYRNGTRGLFATWVVAAAFGLALFDEKLPWWVRAALLGLVGAIVYRNFFQARIWVSGWLPMFAALGIILFLRSRPVFFLAVLAACVYVAVNFDYFYADIFIANRDEGGLQRLSLWEKNLQHVANHPFFGMGPAGYAIYNVTYHPEDARSTHNNYFDILAQTGVIGMAVFLWMLATFTWLGLRTFLKVHKRRDFHAAFVAIAVGGLGASIGAGMLGDWMIPFAYNQTIAGFDHASYCWLFVGGLAALAHLLESPPAAGGDPAHA